MEVIHSDIFKKFDSSGKTEFLNFVKKVSKTLDTSPLFDEKHYVADITKAVYSLIWSGIRGVIKRDAVISTFTEITTYHKDIVSIILDVINVIDAETSTLDVPNDFRISLGYIVKASEKLFTDKLLKERLEIDTLQEFKILSNRNFYTKFIKVKTKLYYKQRKFNLFREESEGYAKLVTELNQDVSNISATSVLEIIKSLIGCFNLDPNRVLDVILDSFEQRPEHADFFMPLIKAYMPDPKILCEVLGFKFSFYQGGILPDSLYTVTALMLQHKVISLDDIYGWLTPDDKVITREWEKEMRDAKDYVRKLNVVSTKVDEKKEDEPEETEDLFDKYERNQKFALCEALLRVGDWQTCQALSQRLPDFCVMDQPPIAKAMCRLLNSLIEPVYRKHHGLGSKVQGRVCPPPSSRLAPKPATTFLELRQTVFPMLLALGPSLHHDLPLVYKLIRVLRAALEEMEVGPTKPPPATDSLYYDTISMLDDVILPTLSHLDANCCVADQIWSLVKLYPYQVRYCLYHRWKNETYQHHSKLLRRKGEMLKKIKFIMKRVSKETIKPQGRQIGKLTHSSPGFLFDYMLLQIQTYDNLIMPVVDALKYLTCMSYDVLCYCIVETLVNAERDRFKHDGMSLSLWLQSLATFCGCLFRKYTIDLTGLMQYLANQLKMQKSFDLRVLNELLQKMAGIETADEMTDDQLAAMSGGDLLKAEAGYFSQVRNTKRSSQRLKEALEDDNLAVALCLLMAQQRYCVVYKETENTHLKLVGKLYDQCQDTLVQFGTFLGSVLSIEDYVNKLPSIHSLLSEYHIHMDVAFFLARPMFNHAINQKFDALRKSDSKKVSKTIRYCEAVAEVMGGVAASVRPLHPPKVWEDISPQFLVTFWSLSMSDLVVPVQVYEREVAKLKQLQATASTNKELNDSKKKKEVERYVSLIDKLQDERKKQQEHVERVMARLKQEKDCWFLSRSARSAKNETITQLLQLCLFPRCLFTCVDALFCAKFVHILHNLQTANFSTLLCYDRLFCDITYSLTSCTENEANRYGRFLCSMLETTMRWHSKKEIFDEECASYPGFVTKFRVSNQFSEASDHVNYENYRHVCHKWHYKITKAIIVCLESKDYVQTRNALIILIKILPHFPVLTKLAQCIEKKIEKIKEEEKTKRKDLFILATSYSGQLKSRASQIMRESDFHMVQLQAKAPEVKQESVAQTSSATVTSTSISAKQVNGDLRQEKEKPSSTVPDVKKESTKVRVSRVAAESQVVSSDSVKNESSVKSSKDKTEKQREREQLEKEKQQKKEERREEAKKMAKKMILEKMAEERAREEKYSREERYTEMPLSKDGELVTRGSYYGSSYYPSQDSQLSSVSNSSSGSLRHTPDQDRETKRRKVESGAPSKSQKYGAELPTSSTEKAEKKKVKKSARAPADDDKELKKERKLNRKRDRLDEVSVSSNVEQKRRKSEEKVPKISSSHQNGDHETNMREKRQVPKEKSPYQRERSHDRDNRDKHRRSGDAKRR